MTCVDRCWKPAACPVHAEPMNPLGRSAPLGAEGCCDNYMKSAVNPRHLWSIHDSTRWYTDPEGWEEHESNCETCNPDEEK